MAPASTMASRRYRSIHSILILMTVAMNVRHYGSILTTGDNQQLVAAGSDEGAPRSRQGCAEIGVPVLKTLLVSLPPPD